jgi:hypothetical protein
MEQVLFAGKDAADMLLCDFGVCRRHSRRTIARWAAN